METYRAHRVLRADRSGSSWPVTVETDAGVFYTKLRVTARVLIDIPPGIPIDDPHQELGQLLRSSIGRNLGFQLLPNAQSFRPGDEPRVDHELASTIVWLDGLVQNPD